jgi:ATP-dependent DNA helicase RecQ
MSEDRIAVRARAEAILRRLAGDDARLRDDQWRAIEALVLDRRRVLCVQRTGWGKSAVYFIATALLRASATATAHPAGPADRADPADPADRADPAGPVGPGGRSVPAGPAVIVSPLLALMRNQVEAAGRAGIHARTINSANLDEWDDIHRQIRAGRVDVLLISPERLNNPDFRDQLLPRLAAATGLLVVDEAHCVSDWGHDFRPDYRRLRTLLAGLPAGTPVLATTATANARVTADVAEQLGDALVLRGPLDRSSLRLGVLDLPSPAHRLGWLADHLERLPGCGIVYTLTVAAAVDTAEFLTARGYRVAAYTGQADDADRRAAEQDLLDNKLKAIVATSALGMGFDKPDLGFVVHLGAPPSPIAYYQQVGRAGRAVEHADVVLLPGAEDQAIWRYFTSVAFPPEEQVRAVLGALHPDRPISVPALEPIVDLRRARIELMLKVLDVDGAVRRVKGGWVATGEPWVYDTVRLRRVARAREAEQDAMRAYVSTSGCRMEYLRRCLDDPGAAPCGRCDRCAGPRFPTAVSSPALSAAQAFLGRPGADIPPKKMWPTGVDRVGVPVKGRIAPGEQALPGRAVGRLSDLGWGPRLRQVVAPPAPDGPVPDDVAAAVLDVLKAWAHGDDPWPARPAGVATVGSRRHPVLIRSTAERISRIGRLPLLGEVSFAGGPTPGLRGNDGPRGNSAQRVRALYGAFAAPPELAAAVAALPGPVLLVDDLVDSGWTMAMAARTLRQAGAVGVLPLALAVAA